MNTPIIIEQGGVRIIDRERAVIIGTTGPQGPLQDLSGYLTIAGAAAAYQPLDADLTAIAALSTTSFGRSTLTVADAAALRALAGCGTAAARDVGQLAGNVLEMGANNVFAVGNPAESVSTLRLNSSFGSVDILSDEGTVSINGLLLNFQPNGYGYGFDCPPLAGPTYWTFPTNSGTLALTSDLSAYVPTTRTVNGQALSGNVTISTITGNAGTATALQTARTINGVSFDGTASITLTTLPSQFLLTGRIDATIAADQNNWNPTGLSTASQIFINGGVADRNITGLAGGAAGRVVGITNNGTTNSIVLVNQSASSTAANRFTLPADVTLPPNTSIELRYDGTASVWRPWGRALANTGVTAGSYGSATHSPTFTVDVAGRITAAANATITPAVGSITGLGTGVATWLATPSSANLRAAMTDEVGSGALYFVGGALGTPASGTVTNLTGTASININGTVGATTPNTGSFTTLTTTGAFTGTNTTASLQAVRTNSGTGIYVCLDGSYNTGLRIQPMADGVGRFTNNASTGGVSLNVATADTIRILNNANTAAGILGIGSSVTIRTGTGSPEAVVTAAVGSLYLRTDGGAATTLYVKESGTGNTGWVAK